MYIHKEGYRLLFSLLAIFVAITVLMIVLTDHLNFFNWLLIVIMFGFWLALASFFRIPKRVFTEDSQRYIAPADGADVREGIPQLRMPDGQRVYVRHRCPREPLSCRRHGGVCKIPQRQLLYSLLPQVVDNERACQCGYAT